jgi:hypothetical protein
MLVFVTEYAFRKANGTGQHVHLHAAAALADAGYHLPFFLTSRNCGVGSDARISCTKSNVPDVGEVVPTVSFCIYALVIRPLRDLRVYIYQCSWCAMGHRHNGLS